MANKRFFGYIVIVTLLAISLCVVVNKNYLAAFGFSKKEMNPILNNADEKPRIISSKQEVSSVFPGREIEKSKPFLNDSEAYKINIWRANHGYYDNTLPSEYNSYNKDTLIKLSAEGDIRAIQLLAFMELKEGEFDLALNSYMDAAMYGSTYALTAAAEIFQNKYVLASASDEKMQNAIEALALLKVAVLRGDSRVETSHIKMFKEIYHVEPTLEQQEAINKHAVDIYNQLDSKRVSLGLGPFNNDSPEEINKLTNMLNHKN